MDHMDKIDSIITTDFEGMLEMEHEAADETKTYTLDGTEV